MGTLSTLILQVGQISAHDRQEDHEIMSIDHYARIKTLSHAYHLYEWVLAQSYNIKISI